jgi:heterodisulfide reductase subunit A-like polyferredoxin
MPDEFNLGLADWHAVHRLYPQAIPAAFGIQKYDRAPCLRSCPANVNAQGLVDLIKIDKVPEALALIMERLPLPGSIGRLCPHPCEDDCRRQEIDEAVAICALERFAADQVDWETLPVPEVDQRDEQVAIVGAGPAGLTCAYHLARMGYRPVIFEAAPEPGGWLRYGIPEYRLPQAVLAREINYIKKLGVEIRTNSPIGDGCTISDLLTRDGFQAVFLGVGCQESIRLSVPGVEAEGVLWGGEFLKDSALGKAPQIQGKKVVVIGSGNMALDVARTARRQDAAQVSVVCLDDCFEMPVLPREVEEAEQEGVEIMYRRGVKQILTAAGKVTGLELQAVARVFDEEGRIAPTFLEDQTITQDCDAVVVAIGQKANLKFITPEDGVELTPRGLIQSDPDTLATSRPGVFAGGEAVSGPAIAIAAVAAGRQGAISIDRYLKGMDLTAGRELPLRPTKEGNWNPIPQDRPRQSRAAPPILSAEEGLKGFKEIHLGFTEEQARLEGARCLSCGGCSECMQCVTACLRKAIDHSQRPQTFNIEVGAVIMAPGFQTFDPTGYESYHYGIFPNVITSLEFERILSASGPFAGHMNRPSDHKEPHKIAWLQCVGSRDLHHGGHAYCSAVCCMYSIKQAVIAQEHSKEPLEASVFFMDLRCPGKGYRKYAQQAEERGVRFIRSRVHSVDEVPGTHDLTLRYLTEDGVVQSETFDLVVLSVGLEVSPETMRLADTLGIALKPETLFADTTLFTPVNTSKPGVFVCGTFQGPKDIPMSITEASAAAAAAGELLAADRGMKIKIRELPPEIEVIGQPPRVGVFVCSCGINIGGVIDVQAVAEYAATLPDVVYSEHNLFTCSADTQNRIQDAIKEHNLNRVVVAACSPRTHMPLYQETIQQVGLNPYLFEMANIRDQDTWVHMHEKEKALEKAKDLVRMAAARAANLESLHKQKLPVTQVALIIGGGVAGLEAARSLADMGFQSYLVEKTGRLGGNTWNLVINSRGYDYQGYLKELIQAVEDNDHIEVLLNSQVKDTGGYIGTFRTIVATPDGERELEHGVTIMTTGGSPFIPKEYLYGQHPNVLLALELDQALAQKDARVVNARQVVFIQCVGSREPERPHCSRVCCTHSVDCALVLKEMNPDLEVFILYRDLCTYGDKELLCHKAREKGVIFVRYDLEDKPQVAKTPDGGLEVIVQDRILGRPLRLRPDLLTLASAILPNPTEGLGELFKVPSNPEGFFIEAHANLRPVDFLADGIFLAGMAHFPKPVDEAITQAKAVAARAARILARDQVEVEPLVAVVNPDLCMGCGLCETNCLFGAMQLIPVPGKGYQAENQPTFCKGCGKCAAACPQRAIDMFHFRDRQIMAAIHAGGRG